jgi:LPXTG-motif cell wall-anchored protein
LALDASNHCETTVVADPPAGSIADGIVEGTSITRPTTGSDVGSKQTITLDGVNSADMCEASGLRIALPLAQLASTGVDAGTFAMAGFAVLAVGGVAVAATRRRKA